MLCGLLFRNIAKYCPQNCNKDLVSDSCDRFVLQKSSGVWRNFCAIIRGRNSGYLEIPHIIQSFML